MENYIKVKKYITENFRSVHLNRFQYARSTAWSHFLLCANSIDCSMLRTEQYIDSYVIVVSNSNRPDYNPPGSFIHRDFPDMNTAMGCHFLLQIYLTQGLKPHLLHYHWATREIPIYWWIISILAYVDISSNLLQKWKFH